MPFHRGNRQRRAHLEIAFPGAVGLFVDIDSPTSLRFLLRFLEQDGTGWLSVRRGQHWLSSIR